MPVFRLKPRPAGLAPTLAAIALFAALCAIVAYWAMLIGAPRSPIAPAGSVLERRSALDLQSAGALFGVPREAAARQAAAAANIQVVGVAASTAGNAPAVAILTVEGNPAKAYGVGDRISENVRLVSVAPTTVVIERAGMRVELPAPARPSIDVLTSGASRAGAAASAPPVAVRSPAAAGNGMPVPSAPGNVLPSAQGNVMPAPATPGFAMPPPSTSMPSRPLLPAPGSGIAPAQPPPGGPPGFAGSAVPGLPATPAAPASDAPAQGVQQTDPGAAPSAPADAPRGAPTS